MWQPELQQLKLWRPELWRDIEHFAMGKPPWCLLRGRIRRLTTITHLWNKPSSNHLPYNPTLLEGALTADLLLMYLDGGGRASAITPWFYTTSFSTARLLGACECWWLWYCLCAECQVPVGKMHQMQLVLAPAAPTQPAWGGTRSSDIFPLYALSRPINTAGSCLVTVLLLQF